MDYYHQHSPTCFGAYCTIFIVNFIVSSELMLQYLITCIELYSTYVYSLISSYLRNVTVVLCTQ